MATNVLQKNICRGRVQGSDLFRSMLRLGLFLVAVAGSCVVVGGGLGGCGSGGSECDKCSTNSDCDSGQSCLATSDGDRCIKEGKNTCSVSLL